MFFAYMIIDSMYRGDLATAESYNNKLQHLLIPSNKGKYMYTYLD